jgi:hypothetical protein
MNCEPTLAEDLVVSAIVAEDDELRCEEEEKIKIRNSVIFQQKNILLEPIL